MNPVVGDGEIFSWIKFECFDRCDLDMFFILFTFVHFIVPEKLKSQIEQFQEKMSDSSDDEDKKLSFDFNNMPKVKPGMFVSGW